MNELYRYDSSTPPSHVMMYIGRNQMDGTYTVMDSEGHISIMREPTRWDRFKTRLRRLVA